MKKLSIALSYDVDVQVPIVLASGKGLIAEKIQDIAKEFGIQLVKDPLLASLLIESDIGSCIPHETWVAVAKIFAFLEKGIKENWL